jgi:hypothetical protein
MWVPLLLCGCICAADETGQHQRLLPCENFHFPLHLCILPFFLSAKCARCSLRIFPIPVSAGGFRRQILILYHILTKKAMGAAQKFRQKAPPGDAFACIAGKKVQFSVISDKN